MIERECSIYIELRGIGLDWMTMEMEMAMRMEGTRTYQDIIGIEVQMFGLVQTTLFRGCGVGTKYSARLLYGAQKMPTKTLGKRAMTKMLTIRKVVRCEVVLC